MRVYAGFVAEAESLDARRRWLADRIAAGDPAPDPRLAAAYRVWPPPSAAAAGTQPGSTAGAQPWPGETPARPGAASPSAQTLLLGLGALLLVVAGAVFAAVVWDRLGSVGQAALMVAATLAVGALAIRLRSRLAATAEALAVVAAGLALVDLFAAPALGLVPESWLSDPTLYPALALVALGLVLLALHARFGLRAWSWLGWAALPLGAGWVVPAVLAADASGASGAAALAIPALTSVGILAAHAVGALRGQGGPMRLAGTIGLLLTAVATAALATEREALPGALVTTALTAAAFGGWAAWERAAKRRRRPVPTAAAPTAAAPAAAAPAPASTRGHSLIELAAVALVGVAAGMALALPVDPQPVWLGAVAAVAGLTLGLVAYLLTDDAALALVAATATWLSWAALRVSSIDPFTTGSASLVQSQLALLAGIAAATALVVAWWMPWTGWIGALLGLVAMTLGRWDPGFVEGWALPFAALLLVSGLLWRRRGTCASVQWLGPAVAAALIPSALATLAAPWAWGDPSGDIAQHLVRLATVLAAGVAAAVAGARWRLGGLLLPAAAALAIVGMGQAINGLAHLQRWVGLGIAGVLLITAGARIEALRREGRRAAVWVGDLR